MWGEGEEYCRGGALRFGCFNPVVCLGPLVVVIQTGKKLLVIGGAKSFATESEKKEGKVHRLALYWTRLELSEI